MQYTGLQVLAFISLLLGTAAVVASIATDYWSTTQNFGVLVSHRGLWRSCVQSDGVGISGMDIIPGVRVCSNRFDIEIREEGTVDVSHKNVEIWEVACLGLMCASAFLGVISLLFSPCCCNRCGACLVFWTLLAALCGGAGVCTYAYMLKIGDGNILKLGEDIEIKKPSESYFMWSFWCGVAGACAQLFATLGFGVSRGRSYSYSHTI